MTLTEETGPVLTIAEITVSIVEDHPLYRAALARLVDELPDCS